MPPGPVHGGHAMNLRGVANACLRCLAAANPFNPIVSKELILASRRRRTYLLRSAYVGIMFLILLYTASMTGAMGAGGLFRRSAMSEYGRAMVIGLGVYQFIALHLIAPAIAGTAIGEEIRKQTLACLLMTPLTSLRIVAGKLLSRMLLVLLLVATSFPVLAILRLFGGVEWGLIVRLEALTLCASLFVAALALTFSTLFKRRASDPASAGVLVLLLIYLAVPGGLTVLHEYRGWVGRPDYFAYFNPFYTLSILVSRATVFGNQTYPGLSSPMTQCGLLLAATGVLVLLAAALVRRAARRFDAGEGLVSRPRGKPAAGPAAEGPNAAPPSMPARHPSPPFLARFERYPVLWRELRGSAWASPLQRALLFVVPPVLLLISYAYFWRYAHEAEFHLVFIEILFFLILGVAATTPGPTITREKESGTLELLLLTPLTPRRIVMHKLWGAASRLVVPLGLLLIHLLLFTLAGKLPVVDALTILVVLAGPLVFLLTMGMYFSLRFKQVRGATAMNQGLAALLWIPCCPVATFVPMVAPMNPFFSVAAVLEHDTRGGRGLFFRFGDSGLFPLLLLLVTLVYVIIGIFFLEAGIGNVRAYALDRSRP